MDLYVPCEHCGSDAAKSGVEFINGQMCPVYTCTNCNAPTIIEPKEATAVRN